MKDDATVTVRFQLAGYWDWDARRKARLERRTSGYSSLRVTTATREALEQLAWRIRHDHPGWGTGRISMEKLLAAIAAGTVSIEATPKIDRDACTSPIGETHAENAGGERMQKRLEVAARRAHP